MENKTSYSLQVSAILDALLPANGVGTEREKLRVFLHNEILKATEELETQISLFRTDREERMQLVEDLRKENEALVKRREHDINHIEQLCRERNDLKIELSNYAYQIDRAKRDRDKAESKVEEMRAYIRLQTLNTSKLIEDNAALEQKVQDLMKENERLKNDLLDALDLKSGSGPTTLTMLKAEIERLTQSNKELVEALKHSLSMMEQTLSYRENNGLTAGNIFLSSTIEQAKHVIEKSKP